MSRSDVRRTPYLHAQVLQGHASPHRQGRCARWNRGVREGLFPLQAFAMQESRDRFRFVRWGVRNVAPKRQEGDPLKVAVGTDLKTRRRARTDPTRQPGTHRPCRVPVQPQGCLCSLHQQLRIPSPLVIRCRAPTSTARRERHKRTDGLNEKQAHLQQAEKPTAFADAKSHATRIGSHRCAEEMHSVLKTAHTWISIFTDGPFSKQS